jgi:hypothetical protein
MDNSNILFTKNIKNGSITRVGGITQTIMITTPNFINDLLDVNINNILNNQAFVYNSTNQKWENKVLNLSGLNGVLFDNPQNGDFIKWDPTIEKWVNRPLQFFSANVSGKLNNALFPNTIYGFNVLGALNYTGSPTIDLFERGLIVSQAGILTGFRATRIYLFTARIVLSPSANTSGTVNLSIGSLTGSTFTPLGISTINVNNQAHEIPVSVSATIVELDPQPDGYTVRFSFDGTYTGITPNDTNFTLSIQEL